MANFIQRLLEIDKSEQTPVLLLLANSFCIGVFIVSYDVAVSTLFLNEFGKETLFGNKYLTVMPIFTGMLGMFSTTLFAFFQRKILFTNLALFCFAIIAIIAGFMFYGLEFHPELRWIKFIAFLFLGPINAIFLLCFYGTVSRSFSLKREKHMTNTVDQGQMVATAISFFAVSFVSSYLEAGSFLIVSIIAGLLALFFMVWFVIIHGDKALKVQRKKLQQEVAMVSDMTKNPYIRMLCLLFLGSVIATIFLEFSFLSVTVQKYTNASDLARFLGVFGGAVTVFSFLLQTFVADWAIKTYGPRIGLILIPTILGLFAILASFIGTFFGYTHLDSSFILFFLFIAMSKMFLQALKEAFEDPIVKTLFIPLDAKTRYDIQIKVEGFFKEFSGFIAGGLLTLIGLVNFFGLIFYSYFLIGICLAYAFVVIRLFIEYRKTLTDTLTHHQSLEEDIEQKDYEVTDVLKKELQNEDHNTVIYTLKLLEKLEPILAEERLLGFLNDSNPKLRQYSILRLEANNALKAIQAISNTAKSEKNIEVRQLAENALKELNNTDSVLMSPPQTYVLLKSRKIEDRIYAAQLISKTKEEAYLPQLLLLLRDTEPRVRFSAMVAAAKIDKHETWPILIEYLGSYTFTNVAAAVLISYGEKVLHTLETAFYKTGQTETIQEKIVQIYGRIQGPEVIGLLWNKIDLPNKKIVNNVLMCLSSCGFRPYGDKINRIKQSIESDIGNSAWIIAALTEIADTKGSDYLKAALDEEIQYNFENIYMLLSLIYDPKAIKLVKDNLESGTVEGVVYALELLDVFLSDELKPIFFPLIEDIPQAERNERLQGHFPRQRLDKMEVLKQIINRDYNSINKWTKACALYVYGNMVDAPMCDDLTANLFNPDDLLREVAGWAIYTKDKGSYHKNTSRLGDADKKELDSILLSSYESDNSHRHMSRIEKILYLKSLEVFKNVPGVILVEFVELIEEVKIKKGATIIAKGTASDDMPIYILHKGKAVTWEKELDILSVINEGELIGEMQILDTDYNEYTVTSEEDCVLLKIDKDKFFEQINDNFEIAKELIKVVSNKFRSGDDSSREVTQIVEKEEIS
jgi:AAA family ATP:ADP antiporter